MNNNEKVTQTMKTLNHQDIEAKTFRAVQKETKQALKLYYFCTTCNDSFIGTETMWNKHIINHKKTKR